MLGIGLKPLVSGILAVSLASASYAATIDAVSEDNILEDVATGQAFVYQDVLPAPDTAPAAATNGWIEISTDAGDANFPGIAVYNEANGDYAGCIMAKTDFPPGLSGPTLTAPNCVAASDSGKRFKLKGTSTQPIDVVFTVTDDATTAQLYRVIGKLSNLTGARMGGFQVELGFGIGDAFTPSTAADGLALTEDGGPLARFPGGLFGGSPAEGLPFFSGEAALFEKNESVSNEDLLQTFRMPASYKAIFGNWLPLNEVPNSWLFDDDGNPDTDDILLAWFQNDLWLTLDKSFTSSIYDPESVDFAYDLSNKDDVAIVVENMTLTLREVTQAEIDVWAADPSRVLANVDTDGTTPLLAPVNFAIWNPETELYDVEDSYEALVGAATLTAEEMQDNWIIGSGGDYEREPGYVQGPVEDLANSNINFSISAAVSAGWTTCVSTGGDPECSFTLRITPLDESSLPKKSSSGGCSVGSPDAPFDPMLPGMLALALMGLFLRRRRIA
jgi:MYXO-CTERM domain-containing protein